MAAAGRAPGGGYGGARARASARGGSCRVQRGRRGALGLIFICTGAGNLGGRVRGNRAAVDSPGRCGAAGKGPGR